MPTCRCPSCKAEVEKTAQDCPSCNRPIAPVNWWKVVNPLWFRHAPDAQVVDYARRWMPTFSWGLVVLFMCSAMAVSWSLWKHYEANRWWMEAKEMIQAHVEVPGVDEQLERDVHFLIERLDSERSGFVSISRVSLIIGLMAAGYIAFHQFVAKRLREIGHDGVGKRDGASEGYDLLPGDSS